MPMPPKGPDGNVGYVRAHQRLGTPTGPCAACGGEAHEWAYRGNAPDELVQDGRRYSLDPAFYQPMCRPCHRTMDHPGRVTECPKCGSDNRQVRQDGRSYCRDCHNRSRRNKYAAATRHG